MAKQRISNLADLMAATMAANPVVPLPDGTEIVPGLLDDLASAMEDFQDTPQGAPESQDTPQGAPESQDTPQGAPDPQESAMIATLRKLGLGADAIALVQQHTDALKVAASVDIKADADAKRAQMDAFNNLQGDIKARLVEKLPGILADLMPGILAGHQCIFRVAISSKGVDTTQTGTPIIKPGNGGNGGGHQPGTPAFGKAAIPVTINGTSYTSRRSACITLTDPVKYTHKPLNHHCEVALKATCKAKGWQYTGLD